MKPYYEDAAAGIRLFHGRAEDVLPALPDASVSLIATDPPYYRVKTDLEWDCQWDTPEEFLAWLGGLCVQWRRVLKPNGSIYVFASPDMGARVEVEMRKHFNVLNRIRWVKRDGWHQKADREAQRSYLSPWEEVVFAEQFGFLFEGLRAYIDGEREAAGLTPEDVNELLGFRREGGMASRKYFGANQWYLPTQAHYEKLRAATGRYRRPWSELRSEFEAARRPFTGGNGTKGEDVWDFPTVNTYLGKHPCEKPLNLMRHIVEVSSRPGDVVLDSFMGYGATLRAAKELGRKAIGIDADLKCCRVTEDRLRQESLFAPTG